MEEPDGKKYSEEKSRVYQPIVTDWVYKEIRSSLGKRTPIESIFIDLPANLTSVVESYMKGGFFRSSRIFRWLHKSPSAKKSSLAKRMLSQRVKGTSRNNLCLFHKFVEQCH